PAFIFAEIAQSTSLLQQSLGVTPPTVLIGLLYLLNGVLAYFVSVAVLHQRVISVAVPLRHGTILTALALAVGIPIVNLHALQGLVPSSGAVFRQQDKVFRREYSVGWDASPWHELRQAEDALVLRSIDTSAPVRLRPDAWNRPALATELTPSLAVPVCGNAL